MKNLIVLGNDKISGAISDQIFRLESCVVYIDRSTNFTRVLKLLKRRVISLTLLAKMASCELLRQGRKPDASLPSIHKNEDLIQAIKNHRPDRLILFRAGLIIKKNVIATGIPILNIHAATVPDYGGIGSIDRALKNKAYKQFASLHIVTTRIDEGEVIDTVGYQLNPELTYCKNEETAYNAAQQLLLKTISIK